MNHFEYLTLCNQDIHDIHKNVFHQGQVSYEQVFMLLSEADHMSPKDIAAMAVMFYHALNMLAVGSKTYKIDEPLHLAMLDTDAKDLTADQIKYPHTEFFIEMPDTNWSKKEFQVYHNKEYQRASGFYVNIQKDHTHFDPVTATNRTDFLFIRIMAVGQIKQDWKQSNFYFFNLSFKNSTTTVAEAIEELITMWSNPELRLKYSADDSIDNITFTQQLFNYVLNIIMYITAKNNDTALINSTFDIKKNRDGMLRKLKKYKHKDITNKHYIYLPKQYTGAASQGLGLGTRTLGSTVFVSGHWRWQACGEKWREHRLVFIEPYQKGEGDVSQTTYIVKEK